MNGSKVWLKYQVGWEMPEQVSDPAVPGQPPLSRCSAQKETVLIPLLLAQSPRRFSGGTPARHLALFRRK
jgi:hypothetical protein